MKVPKISFVIPCYNVKKYLPETLESIFCQTFQEYEIILVDDGSTDGTTDLIHSYNSKVRAIFFSKNRGASEAVTQGLAIARGQFICYSGADDLLASPDSVEKRVEFLSQHPEVDAVYSDWQPLFEKKDGSHYLGIPAQSCLEAIDPDPEIAILLGFWVPGFAVIFRREIVEKVGPWRNSLPIVQDTRFLLDVAFFGGRFSYLPGVMSYYRVRKKGSLSGNKRKLIKDRCQNAYEVENMWRDCGKINEERKVALLKVFQNVALESCLSDRETFQKAYNAMRKLPCPINLPQSRLLAFLAPIIGNYLAVHVTSFYKVIFRKGINLG